MLQASNLAVLLNFFCSPISVGRADGTSARCTIKWRARNVTLAMCPLK